MRENVKIFGKRSWWGCEKMTSVKAADGFLKMATRVQLTSVLHHCLLIVFTRRLLYWNKVGILFVITSQAGFYW